MPPTRAVPQSMHTKCTCAVPRHGQLPPHFAAGNEAAARELAGCHGKFAVLHLAATDDVTDADIVGGSQKGHRRAGLPQRTPKVIGIAHRRTFPEIAKPAQRAIGPPRIKGVSGIGRILLEAGRDLIDLDRRTVIEMSRSSTIRSPASSGSSVARSSRSQPDLVAGPPTSPARVSFAPGPHAPHLYYTKVGEKSPPY